MLSSFEKTVSEKVLRELTRRGFLGGAAGAAAMLGLGAQTRPPRRMEQRTLFFNLSHENYANTSHFLFANGRHYSLTRVAFNPSPLAAARRTNRFLQAVPDQHITHHVEGVMLSGDNICNLIYVGTNVNSGSGTWSMSMMAQMPPIEAVVRSFARRKAQVSAGLALPLSAKRFFYGHPPPLTAQDLMEEEDLVDSTDHARTLIGLHPDLLCAEPNGAAYIHGTYISTNSRTRFLAGILRSRGPADPQQNPPQPNSQGWATLLPINQDNGQPFKTSQGLNQYFPDWHSTVDAQVAGGVNEIHRQVKNDESIGVDVTGASAPSDPSGSYAGKVWYRHDGVSHVSRNAQAVQDDLPGDWQFSQQNGEMGLVVKDPTITNNGATITLDNVNNWFLRFLGMWLQFIDPNDQVIPVSQLPSNTIPSRGGQSNGLDKSDTLFGGILGPPFSVAGIPVAPGQFSLAVNVPPDAKAIKVYYAGFGGSGSQGPDVPDMITPVGVGLTVAINYGLVTVFMAVGVSTIDPIIKLIVSVVGQVVAQEIIVIIGADFLDGGTGIPIIPAAIAFIKGLLNGLAGKALVPLVTAILGLMAASEIIDSIPVAGQIARAVAAVIGGVQLAETTIEVGISPPVYEFDLVRSHDVTVTISPDPLNNQFPQPPSGYILYYKVAYLFDNGSAHTQDAVDVPDPKVASIQYTIPALPKGGRINVMVGFYARQVNTPAGQNDFCMAQGSTGLMDNTVDYTSQNPLTITITQFKIPIASNTQYIHTSKTTLNSQGGHVWFNTPTAPPYVAPTGGQQPGSLGAFRSITVRQGTRSQKGYVGYAWQAYSAGFNDCKAGAQGQLDQAANLNTGADAQDGYSTTPCGLQGGATSGLRLSYSWMNDDVNNFYLDTSSLLVRQVQLNPPGFSNPTQGQSYGQLNMDSTRLLLHPAGHIVSINNANHKIEALKLPSQAVADADAPKQYLARTYSGQGSRPGLITSPAAAAISPEGAILVLEDSGGNNRIQAFDLGGNPIPFFKGQNVQYFLQLAATQNATYLDLAIEFTGYIYVLSQEANGGAFRLDIYHPSQTDTNPISTTRGVNAARLTVDFWRSVYTLNYEVLQLPGGGNPNPPNLTEPSVSLWVPSLPS